MIMKCLPGCEKIFLVDAIRSLLKQYCFVTACFGIASFDVKENTLCSSLHLPITGTYRHDLK